MIAIASDHAGFDLKQAIKKHLENQGKQIKDVGVLTNERCDYPKYGLEAGLAVASGECEFGILVCGTGIGISIAANKVDGVRCVACSEPVTARLSREHNNSNILAVGARIIGEEMAFAIVDEWLNTPFTHDERHTKRIQMLDALPHSAELKTTK